MIKNSIFFYFFLKIGRWLNDKKNLSNKYKARVRTLRTFSFISIIHEKFAAAHVKKNVMFIYYILKKN